MVAQSPVAATTQDEREAYLLSWAAITQMLAQGKSLSGRERNSCFLNIGDARFADASAVSGFDFLDDGRALSTVDWDFDGRLDLWVVNRNGPQLRLLHNRLAGSGHFVALRLQGTTCNRDAIGARVEAHLPGEQSKPLIRTLRAGEAFLSQSSKWIHIGLGRAERIEKLVVRWPGGGESVYRDVAADRQYLITQGDDAPEPWTVPANRVVLEPSVPTPPAISDVARVVLAARPVMPEIVYQDPEGNRSTVDAFAGAPLLVNLWATWCQPCLTELADFAEHEDSLRKSGLKILALNVDELGDGGEPARRAAAAAMLARLNYPFDAGTAGPEALAQLEVLQLTNLGMQIPLALPTSFLLDEQGLVSVIYKGPVTAEQLRNDVSLLSTPPEERRNLAVPFSGRWLGAPTGTEPIRIALKMVDGGDRSAAIRYLERYVKRYRDGVLPEADAKSGLLKTPLTDLFFTLARIHRQEGVQDKAIEAYKEILKIDPRHYKALVDLGHVYLRSGQPKEAAGYLRAAIAIRPGNVDTLSLLATALVQQRKYTEVEDLCRRVLEVDPKHSTARLNLALAAEGRGQYAEAIRNYREALRLLPEWGIAMNQLAWLLATTKEDSLRGGNESLRLAVRLDQMTGGRQPLFLRTLAAAQAECGQYEAAVATVDRALALDRRSGLSGQLRQLRASFVRTAPYRVEPPNR